jgi:hypothetical protein
MALGAGVNSAPFANSVGTYGQVSRTFHCGGDSRCAGCALRIKKLSAGSGKATVVQRHLVASSRARACSGKVLLHDRVIKINYGGPDTGHVRPASARGPVLARGP